MLAASRAMPIPPIPFIVISKGKPFALPPGLPDWLPATLEKVWTTCQNELARLLPSTPHRIATKSSHYVQIEEPQLVMMRSGRWSKPPALKSRRADLRQIQGLNDPITPRPHGAFLCAPGELAKEA